MRRYSTLYGAISFVGADGKKKNQYQALGRSEGLPQFLKELKVTDVNKALNDTAKFLSGFQALPGYSGQPVGDKPMLIRYAPMYLGRRPDWNNDVGSYCAISGSSPDNMAGNRDGKYYHTHFLDKEMLLHSADGYNYLDHIFGAPFVTWQENEAREQGRLTVNFDKLPSKVAPVMRPMDETVVKAVTAALLSKAPDGFKPMKVVLKLEQDCVFNRRAMDLLTQIYSLLPPAMAAEIGFASYQHPDKIRELYQETSIRLFLTVVGNESANPNGTPVDLESLQQDPVRVDQAIDALAADDVWVLDLNRPLEGQIEKFESDKKLKMLKRAIGYWYNKPWEERVQIMEQLFVKVTDPQDGRLYTEVTRAYDEDPFWAWRKTLPDRGTVDSLEGLKAKFDQFPICATMPYAREQFNKVARRLLKEKGSLPRMVAEVAERIAMADDVNAPQVQADIALYEFGKSLLTKDITLGVSEMVKKETTGIVTRQVESRTAAEIAGLKKEKADADAAHRAEVQKLNEEHQAEKAAAVAEEQKKTAAVQAELDEADRIHDEEITKLNEEHQAEKAAAVAEEQKKTAAVQAELDETVRNHKTAMDEKDTAHKKAMDEKDAAHVLALQKKDEEKAAAVAVEAGKTAAVQKLLDDANATLKGAEKAYDAKVAELNQAVRERDDANAKVTRHEAEIARLNEEYEIATGKRPPRPVVEKPEEPKMTILGVEMPKSAMKVIAIIAAAALIVGALVSGIIVGALAGGKDEPIETTPPTTTAPVETTTAPPETTVPETTVPETTVPETTEPPVQTALLEDGSVDWAYVQENVTFIENVETDPEAMAEMLETWGVDHSNWNVEAVITVTEETGLEAEQESPPFVVVLKADEEAQTGTSEEETTDYAPNDLVMVSDAILAAGDRALLCNFPYGEEHVTDRNFAVNAMLETAWLILAEDAQLEMFRYNHEEGGSTVDLTELLAEKGWRDVYGIHFEANKMENYQFILSTARTPVSVVYDLADIVVFDYADAPEKAQILADKMTEKGHTALIQDDFVLIQVNEEALSGDENA